MSLSWDATKVSGDSVKAPIGKPLLDLPDALVDDRGRMAASEAPEVNYRMTVACHEARQVSYAMVAARR